MNKVDLASFQENFLKTYGIVTVERLEQFRMMLVLAFNLSSVDINCNFIEMKMSVKYKMCNIFSMLAVMLSFRTSFKHKKTIFSMFFQRKKLYNRIKNLLEDEFLTFAIDLESL